MGVPHQTFLAISLSTSLALSYVFPTSSPIPSILLNTLFLYATLALCHGVYTSIIYPKLLSPVRHLPKPPGGGFLNGQFWRIFREPSGTPHREWIASVPNNGLIYYTTFLNAERVFVTSVEAMKEVLTSKSYEFIKPPLFIQGVGKLLGIGVLFAEGDEHRRQRKALMPAFNFRHIKDLYPLFWDKTRELVLALDDEVARPRDGAEKPDRVVKTQRWASRATLDIIGEAGMGKTFGAIENEHGELVKIYETITTPSSMAKVMQLLNLLLPFWVVALLPVKRNNEMRDATRSLRRVCRSMIAEKHERLREGKQSGIDILSIAIESGGFSDENLVDQMMTFLAAGHETTATALTWAILNLCHYPGVQKRLREELKGAHLPDIRDPGATISSETIDKIPYLNAVCNEVLRFSTPVPFTFREAVADEYIQGQIVPKGTTVVMSPLAVNLSKKFWGPDADEFKPDRWMGPGRANTGGATSNYAFLTFLHGPRSCIGQQFSKAEFACLLAGWVQAFDTVLEDPNMKIEVQSGITSRPKGGLPVVLTPVQS